MNTVLEARDLQQEWLSLSQHFGSLVEPKTLKILATEGATKFGQGVICLAIRNCQPCSFYLPMHQFQHWLGAGKGSEKIREKIENFPGENAEILLLATVNDLERERIGYYHLFFIAIEN